MCALGQGDPAYWLCGECVSAPCKYKNDPVHDENGRLPADCRKFYPNRDRCESCKCPVHVGCAHDIEDLEDCEEFGDFWVEQLEPAPPVSREDHFLCIRCHDDWLTLRDQQIKKVCYIIFVLRNCRSESG